MLKAGMKVNIDSSLEGEKYSQLVSGEYTVKYSYMTSSFTWVVLQEFPDQVFNASDFGYIGDEGPYFAVKTTHGGFLISDLEALCEMDSLDNVLDYKELQNLPEVWDYFAGCAVCGRAGEDGEKAGYVVSGDLVILPVCLSCCQKNPRIKATIPKQLTYHDVDIDWWEELKAYGEINQRPGLNDDIQKEMEAQCDACEKAGCHPDCSAGICSTYLVEDYLSVYHKDLFAKIKPWAEEKLRQAYPDPAEQ